MCQSRKLYQSALHMRGHEKHVHTVDIGSRRERGVM
jgi:hypothetical protein